MSNTSETPQPTEPSDETVHTSENGMVQVTRDSQGTLTSLSIACKFCGEFTCEGC